MLRKQQRKLCQQMGLTIQYRHTLHNKGLTDGQINSEVDFSITQGSFTHADFLRSIVCEHRSTNTSTKSVSGIPKCVAATCINSLLTALPSTVLEHLSLHPFPSVLSSHSIAPEPSLLALPSLYFSSLPPIFYSWLTLSPIINTIHQVDVYLGSTNLIAVHIKYTQTIEHPYRRVFVEFVQADVNPAQTAKHLSHQVLTVSNYSPEGTGLFTENYYEYSKNKG